LHNRFVPVALLATIIAIIAALGGATWLNFRIIDKYPGTTDFLPAWVATQSFLETGSSPYSPESTAEIQRLAGQYPDSLHSAPDRFLFPLYSVLLFVPFALIEEFNTALAVWMTVLELAVVLSYFAALRLSRWNIHKVFLGILLVFALLWYPGLQSILDGNPTILCLLFITAALRAIDQEQDVLAGIMFALASIKPQIILLMLLFVFIWAISVRRWLILWSTLGSLFVFIAATSIIIPDWLLQYVTQVIRYLDQVETGTTWLYFQHWIPGVGNQIAWLLTGLVGVLLIVEWSKARGKEFPWFAWTALLTLVATPLSGLPAAVESYTAFLPAVILVMSLWDSRWGVMGKVMIITSLILLTAGLGWLAYRGNLAGIPPELSFTLFILLPMFMGSVLYWVRWWAIRPPRLFIEKITQGLNR
jgi:hypothetical protein